MENIMEINEELLKNLVQMQIKDWEKWRQKHPLSPKELKEKATPQEIILQQHFIYNNERYFPRFLSASGSNNK